MSNCSTEAIILPNSTAFSFLIQNCLFSFEKCCWVEIELIIILSHWFLLKYKSSMVKELDKVCILYQSPGKSIYIPMLKVLRYHTFTTICQTYLTTEFLFQATTVMSHGLLQVTKENFFLRMYFIDSMVEVSFQISFISRPVAF